MRKETVKMEPDFTGYVTKAGLECSDGRTIMPEAFQHMDGQQVPLVWQHVHNDHNNVLGYVILHSRDDGVWGEAFFNDTDSGKNAKKLVQHGDVSSLSIYANKLVERSKQVFHGVIREVSLVLAGANPGAVIENVALSHGDWSEEIEDAAIIRAGESISYKELSHADDEDEDLTVEDVYNSFTEAQKSVVHAMVGAAIEAAGNTAEHDDINDGEDNLAHKEGSESMTRNLFEQNDKSTKSDDHSELIHGLKEVMSSAVKAESSSVMKAAKEYALEHGINDIEILFPEARAVTATPEFDKRRTEWVADVLGATKKLPWSRIKSRSADITQEAARAKGYIKGNMKKQEWFGVSQRTTHPTTVYKKQQLDRDDIIDITEFDVVAWMWGEMRLMLDEELARAILIGDGREVDDEDKIKDPMGAAEGTGIRSILHDHELYAATVTLASGATPAQSVDGLVEQMGLYKGTGTPVLYTTRARVTKLMLARDGMGRRLYRTKAELADELMVSRIVEVEVMEDEENLFGIVVNLADYSVGTDRGGQIATFDDFDIDYNQYKYLIETRLSGALTKIRSALVVLVGDAGDELATPVEPDFDGTTITIPTVTGVVYDPAGPTVAVAEGETAAVTAAPAEGYYFANNVEDEWLFTNEA
jgi:HK97 family phage prohead protease